MGGSQNIFIWIIRSHNVFIMVQNFCFLYLQAILKEILKIDLPEKESGHLGGLIMVIVGIGISD